MRRTYKSVVADMLLQAIDAITHARPPNKNRGGLGAQESYSWLMSEQTGFGTSRWCCDQLDYDHAVVTEKLMDRWFR